MFRRPLGLPITLAIIMIVLIVILTVGWIIMAVAGGISSDGSEGFYWTVLSIGTTFLVLVLAGVIVYLVLSIKAINLTVRQTNFIDSVTHELKSPIASLKLYLQTLTRQQVSQQEQEDFYRYMLEDVERLDHLINHVLEAGKAVQGSRQENQAVESVVVSDLLRECCELVRLRYRLEKDVFLFDLQPVMLDALRVDLEIIFRNIIDNAAKYADRKPQIQVRCLLGENNKLHVTVEDNGHGIPPEMRRKVFGRFVRLGLELERKKQGTGLGLYIVRTLVRRYKGRVQVAAPRSGSGTAVEVILPNAKRLESEENSAQEPQREGASL